MKIFGIIILVSLIQCSKPKRIMDNFNIPTLITELEELQNKNAYDGEEFEFWIDFHDDSRYSICPIDAIPFASTGNNGIHFAFLTDFGTNENLEQAPIICVAPSYDPPVNLVAKNLHGFLSLITTIENSTLLADRYKTQEDFEKRKNEWFEGFLSEPEISEPRKKLAETLRTKFDLKRISDIVSYTNQIRETRASEIDYESMDGLGIKLDDDETIAEFDYSKNPEDVIRFLSNANKSSRLLFYRNSYYAYILSNDYDEIVKSITIQFLEKDGYTNEARRLRLY